MEYNNFNKPSKRLLETSKRIEKQTDDYLKRYYSSLKEEQEIAERDAYEKSMSAARFSAASAYARTKQRTMAMNEAINYTNKTSVIGMTEMLSQIVEESLLFDTREYAKTNPNYKQEIRESVRDILENGNILQDIKNRDTLMIMEYVARCIPDIKTGMTLTEDEISAFMTREPAIEVESAISRLSGNIKSRVANLVEKEQARVKKVKEEMPKSKKEELENLDMIPRDEVMDQDQDGQIDQLENPEENMPPEEEGAPMEGEMPPEGEEMPVEGEELPPEGDPSMGGGAAPTKQISITPDGTVNVNIFEQSLYEANANQVTSNGPIARMIKTYLSKYGVKMTWRINKHIAAAESMFTGDPKNIKLAMVAMPYTSRYVPSYGIQTVNEGTKIILFTDEKMYIYGKGILSGRNARTYNLVGINDVVVNEGMVWAYVTIRYKQEGNYSGESQVVLGRINKKAVPALQNFFNSYTNGKFTKTFDKDDENLNESFIDTDRYYDDIFNSEVFFKELDEEIDCIINGRFLSEKFNQTKYIEKTTYDTYGKSGLLFTGIVGKLIGILMGKKMLMTDRDEEIDLLEKLIRRDSKAMSIIEDIKDAYNEKDSARARDLKKEFTIRVKELKDEIKRKGTDSFRESVDNYISDNISKTRLFYKDIPRSGLIESLAVNAAQNMIAESGVYNRDIAFANALTYVTIIEAFAETGLLNVDRVAYNTITQQAGGKVVD